MNGNRWWWSGGTRHTTAATVTVAGLGCGGGYDWPVTGTVVPVCKSVGTISRVFEL